MSSYWLPINTGLLDDERFFAMSAAQRGAWVTAYLALDNEPDVGWFKDESRTVWVLEKHGIKRAGLLVRSLLEQGWLEHEDPDANGRITIRKWHVYAVGHARQAVRNLTSPSRRDRAEEYARRNEERRGTTRNPRRDETRREPPAREREANDAKAVIDAMRRRGLPVDAPGKPHVLTNPDGAV